MERYEETNQECQRHISVLERSIDEHKRLLRKREKELEQLKNEFEHNVLNASSLTNKVFLSSLSSFSLQILFSVQNKMQK